MPVVAHSQTLPSSLLAPVELIKTSLSTFPTLFPSDPRLSIKKKLSVAHILPPVVLSFASGSFPFLIQCVGVIFMGNTISTSVSSQSDSSNTSSAVSQPSIAKCNHPQQSASRPSTAGLSPLGYSSLRKIDSSSSLSNSARFYNHRSVSLTTITSKMSKSSGTGGGRRKYGTTEKVLNIGKPTQFEHGIHVEFNKDNGRFMGLPDVWQQSSFPSDDILDTNYINPNLVPPPVDSRPKRSPPLSDTTTPTTTATTTLLRKAHSTSLLRKTSSATLLRKKPSLIGKPYNVQHQVHVEHDTTGSGFIGLPIEWQRILKASGIPEEVIRAHPKTIQSMMQTCMPESLQVKQQQQQQQQQLLQLPNSPHSPYESRVQAQQALPMGYAPPTRARSSRLLQLASLSKDLTGTTMVVSDQKAEDFDLPTALAVSESHLALASSFIDDLVDHADPNTLYTDFMLIAEGESGPMFIAKHIATSRLVAIKKISKSATQKLSTIRNELTTMKMSRHPNVVEYIGCYKTNEEVWVAMECMDVSLADILAVNMESPKPFLLEPHMARVARDILRALCRIHRLRRIHRDIRSDNVLLNQRGDVKLCDFSHCAQLTKSQPKRNSIVGTPYWMAPEVIKGQEYDAKADIWSLGVLMMEMMQGDPPYVEYPPLRAVFLIASNGLPPLSDASKWSESLKDFVQLCTMTDPVDRPDAEGLLKHSFLTKAANAEDMVALIEETKRLELLRQKNEGQDEEEEDQVVGGLAIVSP
ncbi:kinase-like domain-containing protein [Dichotomocladium elegans]|nr:kinase-like domain-containing protein [Dichotomocladium elegans]